MEYVQRVVFGKDQSFLGKKENLDGSCYKKGVQAEQKVLEYFLSQGYKSIYQRLRTPFGELDLVCSKKSVMVFIEVKYRKALIDARWALCLRQKRRNFYASQWLINQMNLSYDTYLMCVAMVSNWCMECYFNACLEGYDTT
ncbi:hypothetical protein HE1_00905 [Holospora elegans E1]|uniref:Uncharacterized protein n=1 Tax=Holospora elegans E1 TaxID=1427503 RepID=A0A023DZS8_9PROT|nr:YraN family protein [Holospora elegans]GAJ46570.1 hypothetical protein HE1_00905 [Holospora elegans E1]